MLLVIGVDRETLSAVLVLLVMALSCAESGATARCCRFEAVELIPALEPLFRLLFFVDDIVVSYSEASSNHMLFYLQ